MPGNSRELLHAVAVKEVAVHRDSPVSHGKPHVRDDQVWIELHLDADAVTLLARAKGAIEREHSRLQFFKGDAADRAGKTRRVDPLAFVLTHRDDKPVRPQKRVFRGFGEA